MSTTAPEYLTTLRDGLTGALQQWLDQSTTAWDQWNQAWSPVAEAGARAFTTSLGVPRAQPGTQPRRGHHHGHEHEKDCGCGDACDCCVPDADVVVRARAGEVRVVPFRLRNPWRREREVTLQVGPWQVCGGVDLEVRARLEETNFVLGPCEEKVVRLLLTATGKTDAQSDEKPTGTKSTRAAAKDEQLAVTVALRGGDVEACASAYADVRFEGCARPQRVAVVVLPVDCEPVDVGCDCGCCC